MNKNDHILSVDLYHFSFTKINFSTLIASFFAGAKKSFSYPIV
jgi:hypothetical protein